MDKRKYDIAIVGGGPAGSSCALYLKESGLKVALIDKQSFPRHKVCGDAIPEPALRVIQPFLSNKNVDFKDFTPKSAINSCIVHAPGNKKVRIDWDYKTYNCPRYHFDNLLLDMVRASSIDIYEGYSVKKIIKNEIVRLVTDKGFEIECKIVVGADGAYSRVAGELGHSCIDKGNYSIAVSAYYKNVECPDNMDYFFYLRDYVPGYFWVFPVGNNTFNVGFGISAKRITKKRINIKRTFEYITLKETEVSKLFKNAVRDSELISHGLPFGGRKRKYSGDRYLLTGDAASLIDPLQGSGIDKAMISGKLAAEHVLKCFMNNDFSELFNSNYDQKINDVLGKELRRNYLIRKIIFNRPWSINLLAILFMNDKFKKRFLKMF